MSKKVHKPFYTSSNIIAINFISGASGCALRRLLSFGGNTDVPSIWKSPVREDGAAHHMTDKNSIVLGAGDQEPIVFDKILHNLGYDDPNYIFNDLPRSVVAQIHEVLLTCYKKNHGPLSDYQDTEKMIIADHMPTNNLRKIFPNAKIIYLRRDVNKCVRYFFIKNLLQSPSVDATNWTREQHKPTVFDARMATRNLSPVWKNWKQEMRYISENIMRQHALMQGADYIVDADELFENDAWQSQYLDLIEFCELEPALALAKQFIDYYRASQPYRMTTELEARWYSRR